MSACIAFPKWVVPLIITQRCHQFGNDVGTFFVGSQIFILIDFDIRSSEIFIPQYLWPFQDWEGIILINAVILILRLVFTHVTFIRSICNSKVLYSHQCNFCWVQSDHNYKKQGRQICYSFMEWIYECIWFFYQNVARIYWMMLRKVWWSTKNLLRNWRKNRNILLTK